MDDERAFLGISPKLYKTSIRLRSAWEIPCRFKSCCPHHRKQTVSPSRKGSAEAVFLLRQGVIWIPNFKPYRTGMLTVKEKYPCGCGDGHKGRNHADYLCRCNCGREVIFSGDEATKHHYPCGCTPRPQIRQIPSSSNRNFLGYTSNQQNYHIPNILS